MQRRVGAFALAFLALALTGHGEAPADEPVRFVTGVAYGTHMPGLGEPALRLGRSVDLLSGGTLQLDIRQPGNGVAPNEILEAVSSGQIEAGFSTAALWAGKLPAAPLFSGFPFGPDAAGYLEWYYAGNGLKLYRDMYEHAGLNVHVLPCAFGGAETAGWFKKDIHATDDFKGLRMRIFGLGGRVLERLGVSPQLVQGGKLLDAFQAGGLDAAELYPPPADARHDLHREVKRIYAPGWHQPETVLELIVNKDRWKDLTERQQAWLENACKALLAATLANSARAYRAALTEFAAAGVEISPLPDSVLGDIRDTWIEIATQESNRDAFFKEVLDDLEAFRAVNDNAGELGSASP